MTANWYLLLSALVASAVLTVGLIVSIAGTLLPLLMGRQHVSLFLWVRVLSRLTMLTTALSLAGISFAGIHYNMDLRYIPGTETVAWLRAIAGTALLAYAAALVVQWWRYPERFRGL